MSYQTIINGVRITIDGYESAEIAGAVPGLTEMLSRVFPRTCHGQLKKPEQPYVRWNVHVGGYYCTLWIYRDGRWQLGGCTGWGLLDRVSGPDINELIPHVSVDSWQGDARCDGANQQHYSSLIECAREGLDVLF